MMSQYAKVPAETYFAQSTEPLVYVDMVQNALAPLVMDRPMRCWWKIYEIVFKLAMVVVDAIKHSWSRSLCPCVPDRLHGGEDAKFKGRYVHLRGSGHFGPMLRWPLCLETSS